MRLLERTLLLCTLLVAGTAPASAAEGVLEINQDCWQAGCFPGDDAAGTIMITTPGRYALTSDLDSLTITINASDVDLDLRGFTMDGGGTCTGTPVAACSGGSSGSAVSVPVSATPRLVRIHNGTLRGYGTSGLSLNSLASGSTLRDLVVRDNGSIAAAIYFDNIEPGAAIVVERVKAVRNRAEGMRPDTGAGNNPFSLIVSDSVFAENGNSGVQALAGAVVTRSAFVGNANWGLVCVPPCAVGDNAFFGNKPGTANAEWQISGLRDMGGNVCADGACP